MSRADIVIVGDLVAEFLKAGSYLRNWSPQTIETYKKGLDDFARTHSTLTKAELEKWVVEMRSRGMSPGGVNVHIRTMNSFLSYLREDGLDVSKPLKLLKATLTVKTLLSVEDVQKLVKFKPVGRIERRTWTLALLLLDTGIRINEALTLTVRKVDLDNLMLTVIGKGSKERRVVFSRVLRAALWKSVKSKRPDQLLFSNCDGGQLMRRNIYRDMTTLMSGTPLSQAHPRPHQLSARVIFGLGRRLECKSSKATNQIFNEYWISFWRRSTLSLRQRLNEPRMEAKCCAMQSLAVQLGLL